MAQQLLFHPLHSMFCGLTGRVETPFNSYRKESLGNLKNTPPPPFFEIQTDTDIFTLNFYCKNHCIFFGLFLFQKLIAQSLSFKSCLVLLKKIVLPENRKVRRIYTILNHNLSW